MNCYRLRLFDPQGQLKMTRMCAEHHLAYAAGENWTMLTTGNSYQIENVILRPFRGGVVAVHAGKQTVTATSQPAGEGVADG